MIELLYPVADRALSISTPVQREFKMNEKTGYHARMYALKVEGDRHDKSPYTWIFERYANNWGRAHRHDPNEVVLSAPEFIKFSWKADVPSHIEVSFADGNKYPRNPQACELDYVYTCDGITTASMCNFMINTKYAWKVVSDDGTEESETRYLTILDEYPRTLYVQGTANVRDIGGSVTYDGRRLRQGYIYRGGELESEVDLQYRISKRGQRTLHDVLKIKSEMDLRADAVGKHTQTNIGDDVCFGVFPTVAYDGFFEEPLYSERNGYAKKVFEFLADEKNYPIYMHCTAGADRTGTIAYLIEILCGVKMEYMILDYNITALSIMDIRYQEKRLFFCNSLFNEAELQLDDEAFSKLASERVEDFLVNKCGVRRESIENLRKIMLE